MPHIYVFLRINISNDVAVWKFKIINAVARISGNVVYNYQLSFTSDGRGTLSSWTDTYPMTLV